MAAIPSPAAIRMGIDAEMGWVTTEEEVDDEIVEDRSYELSVSPGKQDYNGGRRCQAVALPRWDEDAG